MKEKLIAGLVVFVCLLSIILGIWIILNTSVERKISRISRLEGVLPGKSGVGIVYIYGSLYTSGRGGGWGRFLSGTDRIVEQLRRIAKMKEVKAVVLRINSPGGTVAAVQEVYEEVLSLKKQGKKVVVSMADTCASGGYYIAAAADKIVANPGTLTGSIGVMMSLGNVEELFRKIGIRTEVIKSGKYKDIGSAVRAPTPEEKQLLQGVIDDAYEQFLKAVEKGRQLSLPKVKELAQGQIFTGRQAKKLGLVDELGTLQDAVELVGKLAGIKGEPRIIDVSLPRWKFFDLFEDIFPQSTVNYLLKREEISLQYILR